ncbi:S-adenosyl-L-methionine-dependent methyltransferase [Saccharata proteae CBS 121410]|uniref:S-adenosyl-L-methionine-dependent methyltransferase n=1 Tax=Saccharata proteae CBS 121410 TaxID=1314787 RepID=A0A9P4I1Y5_9PEZI|nr:S-adenosyl-L-methionine-dependent methyltransferase [Saccharata proteae CBS 121410]
MEADNSFDADSTFGGDSKASSTTSLRSEVFKYEIYNGRRYHGYKAGTYLYPNDEKELNRLDIEHHNQGLQLDGALHLSPLVDPQEILDLGTGTGIWAMDMADEYPSAQVMGTDLSPTQPPWVAPNINFEIDDFRQEWTYGPDRFDFIHARFLIASVEDFPALFRQAYHALKPGGWFEINEVETMVYCDDGTFPRDSSAIKWAGWLVEAFAKLGRPWPKGDELKTMVEGAGFVEVQLRELKRPTNDWPKDKKMKEIGRFTCLNYLEGLEGFTMGPFTRLLGWKEEEVQVLIANIRREFTTRSMHGYQKGYELCVRSLRSC